MGPLLVMDYGAQYLGVPKMDLNFGNYPYSIEPHQLLNGKIACLVFAPFLGGDRTVDIEDPA